MNSSQTRVPLRRDIPDFFGSRTKEQQDQDRKTIVYDDHKQTIKISQLIDGVTVPELKDLFSDFGKGKIKSVKIARTQDPKTNEWVDRGFAFVTFRDEETAKKALEYDHLLWNHTRIRVTPAPPKKR